MKTKPWHTSSFSIVCPYCNQRDKEPWLHFEGAKDGEETDITCGNCEMEFNARINIEFTSWRKDSK